jgi:hypothetical protein
MKNESENILVRAMKQKQRMGLGWRLSTPCDVVSRAERLPFLHIVMAHRSIRSGYLDIKETSGFFSCRY